MEVAKSEGMRTLDAARCAVRGAPVHTPTLLEAAETNMTFFKAV